MLFWHFIISKGKNKSRLDFAVLRAPQKGMILCHGIKNDYKIKKNFKKWEAPAE